MKIEDIIKAHKTIAKISQHMANKKVKYITPPGGAYSGSGLIDNNIITICRCLGSLQPPYYGQFICNTPLGQRNVYGCEMKLDTDTIESIQEDITSSLEVIENAQTEIEILQSKIKFMKDNKLKEFDETDFKVYAVLDQLEDMSLTKLQRAQTIIKLVKG